MAQQVDTMQDTRRQSTTGWRVRARRHWTYNRFAYALITPSVIMVVLIYFYPMLNGIWQSLPYYSRVAPWAYAFIGLENFRELFADAKLVAGVHAGTTANALAESIRNGTIADHVEYHAIHSGSTVFMPAGTLHALGPGSLVYEVQETSDLTYRIYDWGRPQRAGRMRIELLNPGAHSA